jgi:hypothetical protein
MLKNTYISIRGFKNGTAFSIPSRFARLNKCYWDHIKEVQKEECHCYYQPSNSEVYKWNRQIIPVYITRF